MHDVVASLRHVRSTRPDVVTVYLNTRWADEHQRDRTRVFLGRELRRAAAAGGVAPDDLAWIAREGQALIDQSRQPEAHGIAMFACHALGLRETIPVRVPFDETFVVDERPELRALAAVLDEHGSALVVFVDGESARLIPLHASGADDEVRLEHAVSGHHRRGGWAQLAQSRYARHIETQRHEHFVAVADAVTRVVELQGIRHIVLAGHEQRLSAFEPTLPERVRRLVIAHVHAAAWEPASAIARRAAERLDLQEHRSAAADVDAILTEAAKGGRAVAGTRTLEAARRGAVDRLYILANLHRPGYECERCGAIESTGARCTRCGGSVREVDVPTALANRVVTTGGTVENIVAHAGLAAHGGLAARLRYAIAP